MKKTKNIGWVIIIEGFAGSGKSSIANLTPFLFSSRTVDKALGIDTILALSVNSTRILCRLI